MANTIYQDIACRTGGDIYIGVVGPVRSGKSTFIKRFMEQLVIPHIPNEAWRHRRTPPVRRRQNDHDHRTEVHSGRCGGTDAGGQCPHAGTHDRLRGIYHSQCTGLHRK